MTREAQFDLALDIHPQAWAVLHLLQSLNVEIPDDVRIRTSALYNGRERGIVVTVKELCAVRGLHAFFAEGRGSDQILLAVWETDEADINPPSKLPEAAWQDVDKHGYGRQYFKYDQAMKVAGLVAVLIERYVAKIAKKSK